SGVAAPPAGHAKTKDKEHKERRNCRQRRCYQVLFSTGDRRKQMPQDKRHNSSAKAAARDELAILAWPAASLQTILHVPAWTPEPEGQALLEATQLSWRNDFHPAFRSTPINLFLPPINPLHLQPTASTPPTVALSKEITATAPCTSLQ